MGLGGPLKRRGLSLLKLSMLSMLRLMKEHAEGVQSLWVGPGSPRMWCCQNTGEDLSQSVNYPERYLE
jgi:hypothetical protein